jgi:hypothetical protein
MVRILIMDIQNTFAPRFLRPSHDRRSETMSLGRETIQ